MNVNQYKFTGDDESYTYPSLITPLVEYIEEWKNANNVKNITIWCPFDINSDMDYNDIKLFKSNYIKIFEAEGYNVISSHIAEGKDFFDYEPNQDYDLIISNPPFKNKKLFFERAIELDKPFALVTTAGWLNDGGLYNLFHDKQLQLLMPDKRSVFFNMNGIIGNRPSFKSIYICKDFLVNGDIKWFKIDKKKDEK